MKHLITGFLAISALFFFACEEPNKKPAREMEGSYTGSMNATWLDSNYIQNSGFVVGVKELTKNSVLVQGDLFDQFEVLVTWNGLNVEPVDPDEPYLTEFIWIGDENKFKFKLVKPLENESAYFIGTK